MLLIFAFTFFLLLFFSIFLVCFYLILRFIVCVYVLASASSFRFARTLCCCFFSCFALFYSILYFISLYYLFCETQFHFRKQCTHSHPATLICLLIFSVRWLASLQSNLQKKLESTHCKLFIFPTCN